MGTGDSSRRNRTLAFRATDAELRGKPGDTIVFRLFLSNGMTNAEEFALDVQANAGEFEGDLRAPDRAVAPGETVPVELEVGIPQSATAGRYTLRVTALLRRDNMIGVAQDLVVVVEAVRTSAATPWLAGAGALAAVGALAVLLLTLLGSGNSEREDGQVGAVTLTPAATNATKDPSATPKHQATPTATSLAETTEPTSVETETPTETSVPAPGPPRVVITTPSDGQVFCPRQGSSETYTAEIDLQADVSDAEDGYVPNERITWTYALDGDAPQFLANSATVGLELHASGEQSRNVDVVVEATDSDGQTSSSSISLVVGGPDSPSCT
jgi:hypothetical protein